MAKKHLLYIHDSRFADEPKKSELVNRLLDEHYAGLSYQTKPPIIKQGVRTVTYETKLCAHFKEPGFCRYIGCVNG